MIRPWLLALGVASLLGCSGIFSPEVPRKIHGRVYPGPFVPEEAYQAFLEGALAEQQNNPTAAEKAYLRAASFDSSSPEPWVRLGAIRCARSAPQASEAFQEALRRDPEFAPLFRERARCAFDQGRSDDARRDATQAVALDPDDPAPPLLLARIALAEQKPDEARRWLRSLRLRDPGNPQLAPLLSSAVPPSPLAPLTLEQLDHALLDATPEQLPALARRARLAPGDLLSRAAALGRWDIARPQARLLLQADPSSADARIALLLAGSSEDHHLALTLSALGSLPPSPVAWLLLAQILLHRSDLEAAEHVLRIAPPAPGDPLAERLRERLRQRLRTP
jgi:tetratricopeptide (TPR) repeat protein